MALWAKNKIWYQMVTETTGADDTADHTVLFKPLDGTAYPTNAVAGRQGTSNLSRWYPSQDLNDIYNYDVYVDTVKKIRLFSPNSLPVVGG